MKKWNRDTEKERGRDLECENRGFRACRYIVNVFSMMLVGLTWEGKMSKVFMVKAREI